MERLPSKCIINFELSSKPCYPLTSKALSDVEGSLCILFDEDSIFAEQDFLLIEFAKFLSNCFSEFENWKDNVFLYDSMDYEDSPIFKIEKIDRKLIISSVWLIEDVVEPAVIDVDLFLDAGRLFLTELERKLPGISSLF